MENNNSQERNNCRIKPQVSDDFNIIELSIAQFLYLKHHYWYAKYPRTYKGILIISLGGSIIFIYNLFPDLFHSFEAWLGLIYYGHFGLSKLNIIKS